MNRKLTSLVCALTCMCLVLTGFAGCLAEASEAGKATRTVMLYFCGSDLEESYALATWNLYQVMQAEIPDDVNVVVLASSAFNGATVTTIAEIPFDFLGMTLHYPLELSESFTLPMESSPDRGMRLVMTPIGEISDLEGKELATTAAVTDLYGHRHDISAAVQEARDAAALGSLTYSIEAAEITVPDAVFNRRQQLPAVTVTLNGETLAPDEDYILVAEKMLKAGTEEITLLGAGDYVGFAKASFTIIPAQSTVMASGTVAASDLAEGDLTVLTVDTPAHPDNVRFDFSATDAALRDSLVPGSDGKSVLLKHGAAPGSYSITVNVIGGGADTYANIDGEVFVIDVK